MKINYNGQELETITGGYWPDGVTLVYTNDFNNIGKMQNAISIRNGRAFGNAGDISTTWHYWAVLPPKPAPRRLTNRELADLCRKGWDLLWNGRVYAFLDYVNGEAGRQCSEKVKAVRAPGSDEWVEPTTELLEVGK